MSALPDTEKQNSRQRVEFGRRQVSSGAGDHDHCWAGQGSEITGDVRWVITQQ